MKNIPGKLIGIPPAILAVAALTGFRDTPPARAGTHPNILLIMVDQMQTPPEGYGPGEGAVQDLKDILGFRPVSANNTYTRFFPGLMRLRENAVVLKKHYTASAASVPSRSCIMTGQYPAVTGVTSTDGLFKTTEDVPFLDSAGTPTLGDWFRAAGYKTHYFGKWHVSEAKPPSYLEPWGFSDWESSYPEPHGGSSGNLGVFRDVVFTDNAVDFLTRAATDTTGIPWFTVASIVNPHDISSYPINWMVPPGAAGVVGWTGYPPPTSIPDMGAKSRWDTLWTVINGDSVQRIFRVDLNPDGFPQNNSHLSPTCNESLAEKPWCQQDYSLKWGLAWGANTDYTLMYQHQSVRSPLPFQLQGTSDSAWFQGYNQFYAYCEYLADLQIRRILQALDDNHLTGNTIVVFISDHGDMTSAHGGMIQKWHNAYEESVRVPMIVSSPLINANRQEMREILQPTSSIDLAPTLLALAGYNKEMLQDNLASPHARAGAKDFPGADLSPYLKGTSSGPIIGPDGNPRTGVLFTGSDRITDLGTVNPGAQKTNTYAFFLHRVDSVVGLGYLLDTGTVRQPGNMSAFCTGDWKIVQYKDPGGVRQDQWEMYCLTSDPVERVNLVDYLTGLVRGDVTVPGMTTEELQAKNEYLKQQLAHATGVAETSPAPDRATLFQNLPNPCSRQTAVPFYLPGTGQVRLSVTDLSGKEVLLLENRTLQAGSHHCDLNAGALASGVYLVRLRYQSQDVVKKMVVMK